MVSDAEDTEDPVLDESELQLEIPREVEGGDGETPTKTPCHQKKQPVSPTMWDMPYFAPLLTTNRTLTEEKQRKTSLLQQWASTAMLMRKYKLGTVLGTGADARVVKAERRKDGTAFAVKVIDLKMPVHASTFDNTSKERESMLLARAARMRREMEIHFKLPPHPNIVECFEVFGGARKSHLVLGLCEGGTLLDKVCDIGPHSKNGESPAYRKLLTTRGSAFIAKQVLGGIRFLHANGVVHRDLKLENLLLKKPVTSKTPLRDVRVVLVDFGSARYTRKRSLGERKPTAHVGTHAYMAPEQHVGGSVDASLDLWSFGIVLSAICTGRHPLREVPRDTWHGEMQKDRLPDGASDEARTAWAKVPQARDLARKCLRLYPNDRVTAAKALKHPWIIDNTNVASFDDDEERTPSEVQVVAPMRPISLSSRRRWRTWAPCGSKSMPLEAAASSMKPPPLEDLPTSISGGIPQGGFDETNDQRLSHDDILRLPRVLNGLRDLRRTKLQKTLLIVVAMRAQDAEVRQALNLFERTLRASSRPDASHLTRDDVEEALLTEDTISLRAADELCAAFEDLSLDGSGNVSLAEFVAGVLALRQRSRQNLVAPLLAELDPTNSGTVDASALATFLTGARTQSTDDSQFHHQQRDSPSPELLRATLLFKEVPFPDDDEIHDLVHSAIANVNGDPSTSLSHDAVIDLLFQPSSDPI